MFLGVDIGTSGVKAVIADESGKLLDQATAPLTVSRPAPLFSEQDPADWWSATEQAVLSLKPEYRRQMKAAGVTGQMHGATLLDESDRVLRPAILWNDGRSGAECVELERAEPRAREITANAVMAGFTAPKLLWVRKHEPEIFERTKTVLLPKDYVRFLMTGEKASDMSDASGTCWLDVGKRRWSAEMLAACGLDESAMPSVHEGPEVTGTLCSDVAQRWGMQSVPVIAGGGDNAAAAVGLGVVNDGDAFISLGTSGVVFVATDTLRPNPAKGLHAFCHAVPGKWHQMSVMLSAASCLDWVAGMLKEPDFPALLALAEGATGDAPIFLPYLTGERTPHANPHAKAVFFGMTAQTGQGEIARAVVEGVAMGLRDGLDIITEAGSTVQSLTVAGGGSRSLFWGRILAGALNVPLVYRSGGDVGPAYGAARLAIAASGGADSAEVFTPPPIIATVEPEPDLVAYFDERQPRFRAIYTALEPSFGDRQ
jgi:xylulokinase